MTKYPQTTSTRSDPVRPPTVASDWAVPLLQALTLAVVPTLAVIAGYCAIRYDVPELFGVAVFFLMVAWLLHRRMDDVRETIWRTETAQNVDIDGDGVVGRPKRPMVVNGPSARDVDTPDVDGARLEEFVNACYRPATRKHPRANSVRALRDAGFTDAETEEFRELLIRLGIARWRTPGDPKAGWVLTASREATLAVVRQHVEWI